MNERIFTWKGDNIETLSREELVEALKWMIQDSESKASERRKQFERLVGEEVPDWYPVSQFIW